MPTSETISLVTGANKGIGLETARRLREAGHRVYLGARNPDLGRPAAEKIGAHFIELDVTSDASVTAAAATVKALDGHLDVLVNNAGVRGAVGDPPVYTAENATTVMLTNFIGYVRIVQAFLPLLERSSNPRIVNVSSGMGSFGLFMNPERFESRFGSPLYGASKAAINMFTARMARLLPAIKMNVADPGMTATDLSDGRGQSVHDGTDAILAFALDQAGGVSGTFHDRDGELPW